MTTFRRWCSLGLPLLIAACGGSGAGGTTTGGTTPGGGTVTKPGVAGDDSFELAPFDLKGIVFKPEGLGLPGMPRADLKKGKTITIEKQRTVVAATKDPVLKQAQAAVLATLLFDKAKGQKPEEQKPLYTEARQVLRDAAAAAGKDLDPVTLRMLGTYEIQLEDYPAAEKAWAQLVAATPKDKDTPYHRAWWGYSLLMQGKNAEALEVVKNEQLTPAQAELAYVIAWAKWRTGDDAGALQAILTAAKQWTGAMEPLQRDLFLFASRANVSLDEVLPQLYVVFNAKTPVDQYNVVAKLGLTAYEYAGRWSDGIAALDKAVQLGGAAAADLLPTIRYKQADFSTRLDQPDVTAKYAKAALDATAACKTCKEPQNIVLGVAGLGRILHFQYATSHDIRYYQPANDIYIQAIPMITDPAKRTETNTDAQSLQTTLKNTKVNTGRHDKDAVRITVNGHLTEVEACYERVLAGDAKISGALSLMFEIEPAGAIKGVSTEPAGGMAGLAAVATCVTEHAKAWKFPQTDTTGTARVTAKYNLSPKQ